MTGLVTIVLGTWAVNTGVSVLTFSQKRAEPFAKYPLMPEKAGTPLKVPCVLPVLWLTTRLLTVSKSRPFDR